MAGTTTRFCPSCLNASERWAVCRSCASQPTQPRGYTHRPFFTSPCACGRARCVHGLAGKHCAVVDWAAPLRGPHHHRRSFTRRRECQVATTLFRARPHPTIPTVAVSRAAAPARAEVCPAAGTLGLRPRRCASRGATTARHAALCQRANAPASRARHARPRKPAHTCACRAPGSWA
jgi:hypothetical protein